MKQTGLADAQCFCDHVILQYYGQKLTRLNADYTETEICRLEPEVKYFSFAHGGVAVFHNAEYTKFVVADLVNFRTVNSADSWMSQTQIKDKLVMWDSGLSLPS